MSVLSGRGGEPTLMGLPFFMRAAEYQRRHGRGKSVSNSLQTKSKGSGNSETS
jgi:uncharacterized protein